MDVIALIIEYIYSIINGNSYLRRVLRGRITEKNHSKNSFKNMFARSNNMGYLVV